MKIALAFLFALTALIPASASARTPMMCPELWAPVCGYRAEECRAAVCTQPYKTYSTSCHMSAEGSTLVHEGECTPEELTPGATPPSDGGQYVPPANCTAWFDGCNSCSRGPGDAAACTLRACEGAPAPGYCTAYETPKPVVNGDESATSPAEPEVENDPLAQYDSHFDSTDAPPLIFLMKVWFFARDWFSSIF